MSTLRKVTTCGALLAAALASPPVRADQEKEVKWSDDWPRVHILEVADIAVLTVASIEINTLPYSDHAKWSKPILFDESARSFFKSNNPHTQELAGTWSDNLYHGMVLAPYIIDNYIVALGVHQNADVALQMTLMDLQSLGLSGVMTLGAEHTVGRARPYVQDCASVPGPDKVGFNHCGTPGDFQSFYSGHAAATFTMAGLTCAHHQNLPLWGGGFADALACIGTVGIAATTGILRLVVDRHWASDVLLGTGIGILNGYVLPMWLHYGFTKKSKPIPTVMKTSFGYLAPIPQLYQGGGGLGVAGSF